MSKNHNNYSEDILTRGEKTKNFLNKNLSNIALIVIISGIIINLFLYLFIPILVLPIDKYQYKYWTPIQSDEYYAAELQSNQYIVPYVDLIIYCESDDFIDLYLFTLYQYSIYQNIKSSSGDLTDIDYLFFQNNFQRRMFLIELGDIDLFGEPIYIVIDPNNNNLNISIEYELRVFEKFWFILSFFLLFIVLLFSIYLAYKYFRYDPWKIVVK